MIGIGIETSLTLVLVLAGTGFILCRWRVLQLQQSRDVHLAALPIYYSWHGLFSPLLPALGIGFLGWILPIPLAAITIAMPAIAAAGLIYALVTSRPETQALITVEARIRQLLFAAGTVAIATTIGILLSLVFETSRFFASEGVSAREFFLGLNWSAQTSAAFGAVPLFFGTFFIALIALCVAAPTGLFSAIYLAEYASPKFRRTAKPFLEILAGVPTVVYGFFAIMVVAPAVRHLGDGINALARPLTGGTDLLLTQSKSALAAGLVMGIMIVPFIASLSDDVLRSVPAKLKRGALAMGATRSEMMKQIVLPAAFPGIMAAFLLAISRAIGETMIVVMAAGERANISLNPFEDITTVTVQIVSLMTGDPEFDSPRTLSAFALGAILFGVTLVFNILAQWIVDRQRGRYATL